ncbi:hypothetical protein ACJMK2_017874, partial [Sinanodonta woodiana]
MSDISIDHNKVCRVNTRVLVWVAMSSLAGISIMTGLIVFFSQPADILTANVRLVIANRNFTENMLDLSSVAWKSIEKPFCAEMDLYYKYSDMGSYYRRCKLRSLRSSADPIGLGVHITLDFQRTHITKNLHRMKEIIMLKSGRHTSHNKLYLVIRNFWVYLRSITVDIKIPPIPENPFGKLIICVSHYDNMHSKDGIQSVSHYDNMHSNYGMQSVSHYDNVHSKEGMHGVSHYDNMHSKYIMQSVFYYDNTYSKDDTQEVSRYDNMHSKDGMQSVSHYDSMHSKDGRQSVSHYDNTHSKDGRQGVSHYDSMDYIASGELLLIAPDQSITNKYFIPRTITTEPIRNSSMIVPMLSSLIRESTISPTAVDTTMSFSRLGSKLLQSPSINVVSTQNSLFANSLVSFSSESHKTPRIFNSNYYKNEKLRSTAGFTDKKSTISWDFETVYSSYNKISNSTASVPLHRVPNTINTKPSLEQQSSLLYTTQMPVMYGKSKQPFHENIVNNQPRQEVQEIKVKPSSTSSFLLSVNTTNRSSPDFLVSSTIVKQTFSGELLLDVNEIQEVIIQTEISRPSTKSIVQSRGVTDGMKVLRVESIPNIQERVDFRPNIDFEKVPSNNTLLPSQKQGKVSDGNNIKMKEVNGISKLLFTAPIKNELTLSHEDRLGDIGVYIPTQAMPNSVVMQIPSIDSKRAIFDTFPFLKSFEDLLDTRLTLLSPARNTGALLPNTDAVERTEMIVNSDINKIVTGTTSHRTEAYIGPTSTNTPTHGVRVIETPQIFVNSTKGYFENANDHRELGSQLSAQSGETSAPSPYEMTLSAFFVQSGANNGTLWPFAGYRDIIHIGEIHETNVGIADVDEISSDLITSSNLRSIHPFVSEQNISNTVENSLQINAQTDMANEFPIGSTGSPSKALDTRKVTPNEQVPLHSENNINQETNIRGIISGFETNKASNPVSTNFQDAIMNADSNKASNPVSTNFQDAIMNADSNKASNPVSTNFQDAIMNADSNKASNPVSTNFQDAIMNADSNKASNPVSTNFQDAIMNADSNIDDVKGNEMTVSSDINNTATAVINHAMDAYNVPTNTITLGHRRGVIETKQIIVNSTKDIFDNVNDHGKLDLQLGTQSRYIDAPNNFEKTGAFDVPMSRNNGTLYGYKDITYTEDTQSGILTDDTSVSNVMSSSNVNLTQQVLSRVDVVKPALAKVRINSFITKSLPIRSRKVQLGKLENLRLVPIVQSFFQSGEKRLAETAIQGFVSGHNKNIVMNSVGRNSQGAFRNSELHHIITTGAYSRLRHEPIHSYQADVDKDGEAHIANIREQTQHNVGYNRNRNKNNLRGIGHKHISLVERVSRNEVTNSLPQYSISRLGNMNLRYFLRSYCPNALIYETYVHPTGSKIRPFFTANERAFSQLLKFPMAQPTRAHLYKYPKYKYLRQRPWSKNANINHLTYINTFSYGSVTGGTGRYFLNSLWNKFVKVNGHVHILPNIIQNDYTQYWYGDYMRTTSTLQSIFDM